MDLRAQLLGSALKVGSIVESVNINIQDNVVQVNLCRPPLSVRDKMQKLMQNGTAPVSKVQALCLVHTLRNPDTGEPIFSDADLSVFEEFACGDWFDKVAPKAFMLVLGGDVEGNSEG